MSKLNHNRPITYGDMLGAKDQRTYQIGYKKIAPAPEWLLDQGCQLSKESLKLKDTLSRTEIRNIRMARQKAAQSEELAEQRRSERKDAQDEIIADFFEKET